MARTLEELRRTYGGEEGEIPSNYRDRYGEMPQNRGGAAGVSPGFWRAFLREASNRFNVVNPMAPVMRVAGRMAGGEALIPAVKGVGQEIGSGMKQAFQRYITGTPDTASPVAPVSAVPPVRAGAASPAAQVDPATGAQYTGKPGTPSIVSTPLAPGEYVAANSQGRVIAGDVAEDQVRAERDARAQAASALPLVATPETEYTKELARFSGRGTSRQVGADERAAFIDRQRGRLTRSVAERKAYQAERGERAQDRREEIARGERALDRQSAIDIAKAEAEGVSGKAMAEQASKREAREEKYRTLTDKEFDAIVKNNAKLASLPPEEIEKAKALRRWYEVNKGKNPMTDMTSEEAAFLRQAEAQLLELELIG